MAIMTKSTGVVLGALLFSAASANAATLVSVVNHPISMAAKKLTIEDVKRNIVLAANRRGWNVEDKGPQTVGAVITAVRGSLMADVTITFTDQSFSITLTDSKGFHQKGNDIDNRANRWIRNLEKDIDDQFRRSA